MSLTVVKNVYGNRGGANVKILYELWLLHVDHFEGSSAVMHDAGETSSASVSFTGKRGTVTGHCFLHFQVLFWMFGLASGSDMGAAVNFTHERER